MFLAIRKYSSYKAFAYTCGRRLGADSWCQLSKAHGGEHDRSPSDCWTADDDLAVALLLDAPHAVDRET